MRNKSLMAIMSYNQLSASSNSAVRAAMPRVLAPATAKAFHRAGDQGKQHLSVHARLMVEFVP